MMDMKHRLAYASVKQHGVKDAVILNEGLSLTQLMMSIARTLASMAPRYDGVAIEISFNPIGEKLTNQEVALKEIIAGLDLTDIEVESDEEAAAWANSPINPDSPTYDPLLKEYRMCLIQSHRETKTPADLATLRKHVESTYKGTEHWDGAHYW
jgi:hypothetical protein